MQTFYDKIKEELDSCKNPLYFFHDDPDGLCSFLLFYRYKKEGHGVIVKQSPVIDTKFLRKVEEYHPDKIFVLDIANVTQDFIDEVKVPIVWIDHHGPYERTNVKYFNPRLIGAGNPPVSYMAYFVVEQDEWISLVGMVSDWYLPPAAERKALSKRHPKLLPESIKRPEDALFSTDAGRLARILSFILKGGHSDAMQYAKVMTRIKDYQEILEQSSPQGRYIIKKFEKVNAGYERLLAQARKEAGKGKFLVFTYNEDSMSFTSDLANELLYHYPKKVILIGRIKSGEVKCSLRSSSLILPPAIEKCLAGLTGHGGGHEHAAAAVVKQEDFEEFLERLKKELHD